MPPELGAGRFRATVIGSPIGHSKSPRLHAAAYQALGIDCAYSALDVDEHRLPGFVDEVRRSPGWRGVSVTMPVKAAMARLVDDITDPARVLEVVNTVVVTGTGSDRVLTGHNTDVSGVAGALVAAGVQRVEQATVLGGGATAAAAIAALARLGAAECSVLVRRPAAVAGELHRLGGELGVEIGIVPWDEGVRSVRAADVLVSTLPPRGADGLADRLRADAHFATTGRLLDVAYDPWPSALASLWQQRGGTMIPGLDMLIQQAAEQVRLFFPEVRQDRAQVLDAMYDAVGAARH
ncbi:shikimate dehydrogenase [Arthrobacter echini]|uniref:Shikimate dehydrogenase n=1 Tax=Arthrobacter echini TaxID=1529066 RepID=A0A4S5E6G2_9MICC|nr:shikimate dehydrogenase [Arthrobacter echini]THJ67050.1 shikimate dehydrogenase [Arthrobacter echini]